MRMRYSLASAMCSKHEWHGAVKASEVRDSTKPGLGAQITGIVNNIERNTTHTLELWHKTPNVRHRFRRRRSPIAGLSSNSWAKQNKLKKFHHNSAGCRSALC